MVRSSLLSILLLINSAISISKVSANHTHIVYCIGNHDATGACWKEGSEEEQKLGCLITSWPIVECENIPEDDEKIEKYECLALQNTGIVNQIALSCQSRTNNAVDEETDSIDQSIRKSTPSPESASTPQAEVQATVLEHGQITPNAFDPSSENTKFGVEQPQDFKQAF